MIHLQHIHLSFGGQTVFKDLNWFIKANRRIGLIGPNGAGKSTLLRVITGEYRPDEGDISMSGQLTLGYLEQEVQEAAGNRTVLGEALEAFAHVFERERQIEALNEALLATTDHNDPAYFRKLERLERLQMELDAADAHNLPVRCAQVLNGLGFTEPDLHRPLATFSGGWRMRVALAKMLLRSPDVLLLDEPTNHLDIESIGWLEGYLKAYKGTVILVSHDRYFLDRMADTIAELAYGRVTEYAGNYSFYLEERVVRRQLQQAAFDNQQKEIRETERFIERFRYKATKARQVQSRVKALEKIDLVMAPDQEMASVSFRFPVPEASGRMVLKVSPFSKSYPHPEGGEVSVFRNAPELTIERGHKIALIGKNGAGKSTLARILLGSEDFDGTRELGYKVELTYFAQHQAESLNPKRTILESLYEVANGQTETELRSLLGAFLFTGDDVHKPISVLSGGERSRVALARTLLKPANFLILDEPTNHLDIQSITVLIEALRQYTGTFVVVSHDRHFLDQLVNQVWYVADGHVRTFIGTYADYLWKVRSEQETAAQAMPLPQRTTTVESAEVAKPTINRKDQKRAEAEARNAFSKLMREVNGDYARLNWDIIEAPFLSRLLEKIEADIVEAEAEEQRLAEQLADPGLYNDLSNVQSITEAQQMAQKKVATLYEWWEKASERMEH
ncbi:MAG: ABC-F family ATP-binding cassette domain-containing protein [Bacteroidetes Order II. Incertae sedis bacterium]|nr:ABC-F family ATP-binding cassette domain-containing protein [Bacteroidetes Order II. bacterium]